MHACSLARFKGFEPGSLVALESAKGQCLGLMHLNPNHLICGRLLTRNPKTKINQAYFKERIGRALELRESIYQEPYYRLMFGDADYLPGVVVDRFGDTLVVHRFPLRVWSEPYGFMTMRLIDNGCRHWCRANEC